MLNGALSSYCEASYEPTGDIGRISFQYRPDHVTAGGTSVLSMPGQSSEYKGNARGNVFVLLSS